MQWLVVVLLLSGVSLVLSDFLCDLNQWGDYSFNKETKNKNCKKTCRYTVCCIGWRNFGTSFCQLLRNNTVGTGTPIDAIEYQGWTTFDSHSARVCSDVRIGFHSDDSNAANIEYFPSQTDVVKQAFLGVGADLSATSGDYIKFTAAITDSSPLNCVDVSKGCTGLTIAFWARISENPSNYNYLLNGGSGIRFRQHGNKLDAIMWRYTDATHRQKTSLDYSGFDTYYNWYNKWINLALTLNVADGTLKLYGDGHELATGTPEPEEVYTKPSSFGDLFIGDSTLVDPHHNMRGSVDEFMLYARVLTQTELKNLRGSYL